MFVDEPIPFWLQQIVYICSIFITDIFLSFTHSHCFCVNVSLQLCFNGCGEVVIWGVGLSFICWWSSPGLWAPNPIVLYEMKLASLSTILCLQILEKKEQITLISTALQPQMPRSAVNYATWNVHIWASINIQHTYEADALWDCQPAESPYIFV